MTWILGNLEWVFGGGIAVIVGILVSFFGGKSSGKKEGVQQERTKQVEQMAKAQNTVVTNTTVAKRSTDKELDQRLSKWQRK